MNYQFSKDYKLLWELAQRQEVIYRHGGFIGFTASINNDAGIGLGPCWFYSKQTFIKHCEYYKIQFLIPGEVEELVGVLRECVKEHDEIICYEQDENGEYNGKTSIISSKPSIKKAKELLKKYEVK